MIDVLANYVEATVTAGGTTAPAAGTAESWTVTTAENWPTIALGQQIRVMDKADLTVTSGYEIMIATPIANGTGVTWTVTRGVEGTAPKAHAADWTVVPATTAGGIGGRLGAWPATPGTHLVAPPCTGTGDSSPLTVGQLLAVRALIPAGSSDIVTLSLQFAASGGNPWGLALYDDTGPSGSPGDLLANTSLNSAPYTSVTATLPTPLAYQWPARLWAVCWQTSGTADTIDGPAYNQVLPDGSSLVIPNNLWEAMVTSQATTYTTTTPPSQFPAYTLVQASGTGGAVPVVFVGF